MARSLSRPQSPWLLPCSNAHVGEVEKDVQLTWLSWNPPTPVSSRPSSGSGAGKLGLALNRSGHLSSISSQENSIWGSRRRPINGCSDTTVLTFNQVTYLPSIQWARKRAVESRKLELATRERSISAQSQSMKRHQSEPQMMKSMPQKLGKRRKHPQGDVSHSTSQTPSVSSGSSILPSAKAQSSQHRKSNSSMRPLPAVTAGTRAEENPEDQTTVQARVLAGSRNSYRYVQNSQESNTPQEDSVNETSSRPVQTSFDRSAPHEDAVEELPGNKIITRPGRQSLKLKKTQSIYEALDKRTLRLVFWKFAGDEGLLARDNLRPALQLLGYKDVLDNMVSRVATDTIGRGIEDFTFHQYEQFCEAFDKVYMMGVMKGFREADLDNDGKISSAELSVLLQRQGITVMPGMVQELLEEVGGGTDQCLASMEEYTRLVDIVRQRGGFTKQETQEFTRLFRRFDYNDNGQIDEQEFKQALKWLGFEQAQHNQSTMDYLLEGVDREGGEVLEPEFLQAMRRYREFEISWISDLFKEQDADCVAVIDAESTVKIFKALGFPLADEVSVTESAAEMNLPSRTEFFFEDIVMMVRALRAREGFLEKDVKTYREVFDSHDMDGSGQLDVVELGGVLRWLGNPAGVEIQQDLMEEVDVDRSGFLDFGEFLKAMRRFQEQELSTLQTLFKQADMDNSGMLSFREFKAIYRILGFDMSTKQMDALKQEFSLRDATFDEVYSKVSVLREQERQRFRECAGFNQKELRDLDIFFKSHSQNGKLSKSDLINKMSELMQSLQCNDETVDTFVSKHGDESGCLLWKGFLQCIRLAQDRHEFNKLEREEIVAKQNEFTRKQVIEFRRVFKICHKEGWHQINYEELIELFGRIMKLPHLNTEDTTKLRKAIEKEKQKAMMKKGLDFEHFLLLMGEIAEKRKRLESDEEKPFDADIDDDELVASFEGQLDSTY